MSSDSGLRLGRGGELIARATSPARERCDGWRLRSVESSIPVVRRELRSFLREAGLAADELDDLVLATCEAATNAVEHAQHPREPYFDVSAEIDDGVVVVAVRDYGQWQPPEPNPIRGRGLAMMGVLADTTLDIRPQGTTVTMRTRGAARRAPAGTDGRAP